MSFVMESCIASTHCSLWIGKLFRCSCTMTILKFVIHLDLELKYTRCVIHKKFCSNSQKNMVLPVSYVYLVMIYTCFMFITAMFYCLLDNIRPRYHSQLKAIQLAAVVNTSIIDSNGIDAILAPLVDDIKKLEKV